MLHFSLQTCLSVIDKGTAELHLVIIAASRRKFIHTLAAGRTDCNDKKLKSGMYYRIRQVKCDESSIGLSKVININKVTFERFSPRPWILLRTRSSFPSYLPPTVRRL